MNEEQRPASSRAEALKSGDEAPLKGVDFRSSVGRRGNVEAEDGSGGGGKRIFAEARVDRLESNLWVEKER